ncbi:MAG: FAD:protein FMN transferase [Ligilactobacillus agilis]|nr:FAD:protein FMN transferase [Ligilactobacillus agilis]
MNTTNHEITANLAQQTITKNYRGLGTQITLTAFGTANEKDLDDANELIKHYEDIFTVNREHSEIMDINQAAGQHPVQVSNASYQLVKKAIEVSRENNGFDALIGPLVKLWHIGFSDAKVPTDEEIKARLALIDPKDVALNDNDCSVYLKKPGMEIDLGAIAKGYIADRIRDLWRAKDLRAGIINLGGNILLHGTAPQHPDGLWRIGVQDPSAKRGQSILVVTVPECSAVTSGIYERHLKQANHDYHHIIDPQTGYPHENDLAGVTVFTQTSISGEIETERLFFAGEPQPNWLADHPDALGAVFVDRFHHVKVIGFTPEHIRILDSSYQIEFK